MTTTICTVADLAENSGICALIKIGAQEQQIAIYYLPATAEKVFAISNWDPLGQANVMSRGIVGSIGDELVVASPLYKQHYSLISGKCFEADATVPVFKVSIDGQAVVLAA